jgi:uncharacterized caspase-like protein
MQRILRITLSLLAFLTALSAPTAGAAPSEKRLALVIGNASYHAKTLASPVNDAALIAQTLQAAGFDVMGARDLDEDSLRQAFHAFIDGVTKAGADAVAFVYFAGYGLQLEGENYLMPIDADIASASEVPLRALRLSDQTHALGELHLKTTFVILDAARTSPFAFIGQPLADGLAWVEPETNMLVAFNAAPSSVAPDGRESYGPYAKALAEMIREGSLTPANVFDRTRLRVSDSTKGAQVPWNASKIETQFVFLERGPAAPPRADSPNRTAWMRSQPLGSLGADDAYMVALLRDTFDGYAEFLAYFSHDPMARRVRALLAARREAITWRRTYQANVAEAYWSYAKRYPRGPHRADASRLLAQLGAAIEPPSKFAAMDYDVPMSLPGELEYIERPVLVFDDPAFGFQPPPPSPVYFLEPPPSDFLTLHPPATSHGSDGLPGTVNIPLPAYVSVPDYVVASDGLFVSKNSHKALVVNNTESIANTSDSQGVPSPPTLPPGMAADRNDPAGSAPRPRSTREEINAFLSKPLPGIWLPSSADGESAAISRRAAPVPTPERRPSLVQGLIPAPQASAILSPYTIGSRPPSQPLPPVPSLAALPTDAQTEKKPQSIPDAETLAPPAIGSIPLRIPAISPAHEIGSMPKGLFLPGVSSISGRPTEDQTWAAGRIATFAPTTDSKFPVLGPEMQASPAAGSSPTLMPAILSPPATGSIPLPIPRNAMLAPPTTGGVPLPLPRPAAFPPRTIATQSQPIPRAASGVPPANQAGQPTALNKLASPPALARAPQVPPEVLQAPKQLCPVVNGRRICN